MRRDGFKYEHVLSFALEHPWAVTAQMRDRIAAIIAQRIAGQDTDPAFIAEALDARSNQPTTTTNTSNLVAVIPIHGVIAPRANLFSEVSGGTTFEGLTAQLHAALENPAVKTIVFDVNSPGGNVAGATEFSREVMKARSKVTVIAQAEYLMASAAYWAVAGATEIVASPSAIVGSIGVFGIHDDISAALDKLGIKRSVIAAGKYKAEGQDGGPLSDEARAHMQNLVDSSYARFVGDVAKGRGVNAQDVRNGYGEGRTVNADLAMQLGMIDSIATLADTLARVTSGAPVPGVRAAAEPAATRQEPPLAATRQEPRSIDPSLIAFERRLLDLHVKGLQL
jgi:signal peptide peptidase SppA